MDRHPVELSLPFATEASADPAERIAVPNLGAPDRSRHLGAIPGVEDHDLQRLLVAFDTLAQVYAAGSFTREAPPGTGATPGSLTLRRGGGAGPFGRAPRPRSIGVWWAAFPH